MSSIYSYMLCSLDEEVCKITCKRELVIDMGRFRIYRSRGAVIIDDGIYCRIVRKSVVRIRGYWQGTYYDSWEVIEWFLRNVGMKQEEVKVVKAILDAMELMHNE